MNKIEFKVGHKYENMKGIYEVISVDEDSMIIRWGNGEQVSTPKDLQRTIIERMQQEKQMKEKSASTKKTKKGTTKIKKEFAGFAESDFKNTAAKTSWRSRSYLGGAVTDRLNSDTFSFKSWAVSGMPTVHWYDVKHREQESAWIHAKFFTQIDENNLYYGFYIERPDSSKNIKNDWDSFISWLKNEENEKWLNKISSENDLYIYDSEKKCFKDIIKPCDDGWKTENEDVASLSAFFSNLPEMDQIGLHIAKIVSKDKVLTGNETIADDISKSFQTLMPLYESSAGQN